MANPLIPPWLSSNANGSHGPPSPSVVLTLSSSTTTTAPLTHLQTAERGIVDNGFGLLGSQQMLPSRNNVTVDGHIVSEIIECCRDLEDGHKAWMAHKKEAAWRLKRVELQLESEKACKRREKMEEIEAKVRALREEQLMAMERIESEYREQIFGLRRDAEAKEQKLAEQWAAKHMRLSKFLEQVGFQQWPRGEMNGH